MSDIHKFIGSWSGKSVAWCHRTMLAYWKFESISLQQTVRLFLDLPSFLEKPGFPPVWGRGQAARSAETRRSGNIALMNGGVSVGRYFSTAVSPMRFAPVGAPPPSAVAPLEIQRYR